MERVNYRGKKVGAYERDPDDYYIEDYWLTFALLDFLALAPPATIYDPACGSGRIPAVARSRGFTAYGSDLKRRIEGAAVHDYLSIADPPVGRVDWVITNPPFTSAVRFAERALTQARVGVAMIQRLAFLETVERADFFAASGLSHVAVSSDRTSMPPGAEYERGRIEAEGGRTAYAWFIWRQGWRGPWTGHFIAKARTQTARVEGER